jgi:RNA polymerase sigma-70 factor (ECF subfamily)
VQGCLLELIAAGRLQAADPERGRFRTFLLACLKNHRAKSLRAAGAEKRGGQTRLLSLDFERAEASWNQEPQVTATPDLLFDRKWALLLLKQCGEQLQREATERGKAALFAAVEPYLAGYDHEQSYQDIATQLGLNVTAVKVTVHRWRNRLKELIRQEIRQTVADDAEVDQELEHLLRALTS